ncbi:MULTISPECIES: response regulator [unclassified Siphonobacter]|uniref:response regulator n=1 Tax=unclassified Siphonobacter TaxID=2635712 RepID=UPI0027823157|nr:MULTISPECIES: response regulator [unclassified Siphonobacter]MDQ1090116.1 two-component system chemotaxis response regulator CheY [Siphonobacter sp. SORGH_AS_1065]MDR6197540.1 two-component system chemotaxis response regulator CheY [Siphonobacter sp. SORGH_AS_0500]
MNILVVDDERDVQALFEQRFRREIKNGDFRFFFSFSGEEALTCLEKEDSEIVLILSDINMPGMSGLDLLQSIRHTHPSSPPVVMMITAYGDEETHAQALKLGANDFLTKPLNFGELKVKLKETL